MRQLLLSLAGDQLLCRTRVHPKWSKLHSSTRPAGWRLFNLWHWLNRKRKPHSNLVYQRQPHAPAAWGSLKLLHPSTSFAEAYSGTCGVQWERPIYPIGVNASAKIWKTLHIRPSSPHPCSACLVQRQGIAHGSHAELSDAEAEIPAGRSLGLACELPCRLWQRRTSERCKGSAGLSTSAR